nr:MAG TPA: hypothetical protein [Caudoviricetes sp.]
MDTTLIQIRLKNLPPIYMRKHNNNIQLIVVIYETK